MRFFSPNMSGGGIATPDPGNMELCLETRMQVIF